MSQCVWSVCWSVSWKSLPTTGSLYLTTVPTYVIATMPETSIHINEKVTRSAATCVPRSVPLSARVGRAAAQQSGGEM